MTSRPFSPTVWSRFSAPSTCSTASRLRDASSSICSTIYSLAHRFWARVWIGRTSLQELTAEHGAGVPVYEITATGPDHDKEFTATVLISGKPLGVGVGRSKKEAEQKAASSAWKTMSENAAATAVAADDTPDLAG